MIEEYDRLIGGDTRGNLWLFEYSTGQLISNVRSHQDRITGLALNREDKTIVACSKDSFMNIYVLQG